MAKTSVSPSVTLLYCIKTAQDRITKYWLSAPWRTLLLGCLWFSGNYEGVISYAGCPGLSWMVSVQFILKICIAAENRWKFAKTHILGVQGRSRSSMLVPLESSSTVLVMISSKSVSICNRFHARRANSGKITNSKGGIPLFDALVRGESPTLWHQIT